MGRGSHIAVVVCALFWAAPALASPETGPVVQVTLPLYTEPGTPPAGRVLFVGRRFEHATVGVGIGAGAYRMDLSAIDVPPFSAFGVSLTPCAFVPLGRGGRSEVYAVIGMPLYYGGWADEQEGGSTTRVFAVGGTAGFGGQTFVSRRFAVGAEASLGAAFPFLRVDGERPASAGWQLGLQGALTATVIL